MTINSKAKGSRGELELVNFFKEKGLQARRTQQYCGNAGDSDILCDELNDWFIECKRVKRLNIPEWMRTAKQQCKDKKIIIFHRADRDEWLATVKADDFLELFNTK